MERRREGKKKEEQRMEEETEEGRSEGEGEGAKREWSKEEGEDGIQKCKHAPLIKDF